MNRKNYNKKIVSVVLILLIIAAMYAISWAVICGLLKLVTLCFGLPFSLPIATGIWLIICLIKLIFGRKGGEKK